MHPMIRTEEECNVLYGHMELPMLYMQLLSMSVGMVQAHEVMRDDEGPGIRDILKSYVDELDCLLFVLRKKIEERP